MCRVSSRKQIVAHIPGKALLSEGPAPSPK